MSGWGLIGTLGGLAGGYAMAEKIGATGDQAAADMGALASQLQGDTQFKGYGVTTGLGSSAVGTDGTTTIGVGPDATMQGQGQAGYGAGMGNFATAAQQMGQGATNANAGAAMNAMMGGTQGLMAQQMGNYAAADAFRNQALQDTASREQDIYNRAMAMQQPALDAQRAQTNAQEFASGRGGVMGSQFGGSGEDAAMARAQAQAQNQAAFQAMGQASQEQAQQAAMAGQFGGLGMQAAGLGGTLGNTMNQAGYQNATLAQQAGQGMGSLAAQQAQAGLQGYQTSFLPMEQQMAAMGLAQNNANLSQTGQLSGAGYAAQLGLGGIQAQINAQKAASELYGNLFGSVINNSSSIGDSIASLFD